MIRRNPYHKCAPLQVLIVGLNALFICFKGLMMKKLLFTLVTLNKLRLFLHKLQALYVFHVSSRI